MKYFLYTMFGLSIVLFSVLEILFFILNYMMGHTMMDSFVFWLCSLALNIFILILDKVKKLKIYFTLLLVIIINFILIICMSMFYGYSRILSTQSLWDYFVLHHSFFIYFMFLTGNWLLPIIYSLRRSIRNYKARLTI